MPSQVSVVVITRNRPESLRRTLAKLGALDPAPRVIVVDNGSSPAQLPPSTRHVRVIALPRNAGAAGRNFGVAAAETPYVAFSDDDSWWAPEALAKATLLMQGQQDLGLLAGRILVGAQQRLDPVCDAMIGCARIDGFVSCGAIVRRSAFLDAGGFHPRFGVGGEEALLAIDLARRGWRLAYCDDIVAHHWPDVCGERPGRRARMVRNDLWTAWLRARPGRAMRFTSRIVIDSLRDLEKRKGLGQALAGLPWVLRERAA